MRKIIRRLNRLHLNILKSKQSAVFNWIYFDNLLPKYTIYIYMRVCVCVCVYIYIYIYIHTHTRRVEKFIDVEAVFTKKKGIINETWIFFQNSILSMNMLILASFQLIKAPLKFSDMVWSFTVIYQSVNDPYIIWTFPFRKQEKVTNLYEYGDCCTYMNLCFDQKVSRIGTDSSRYEFIWCSDIYTLNFKIQNILSFSVNNLYLIAQHILFIDCLYSNVWYHSFFLFLFFFWRSNILIDHKATKNIYFLYSSLINWYFYNRCQPWIRVAVWFIVLFFSFCLDQLNI